ncbi:hypothetical protein [Kitasatospora sp. NPDC088346]|uniref:hypothetical protein n=1 Tax=Kitasatospora sp. NPDC088346 TaxID=3364073 RepID=UPI0038104DF7
MSVFAFPCMPATARGPLRPRLRLLPWWLVGPDTVVVLVVLVALSCAGRSATEALTAFALGALDRVLAARADTARKGPEPRRLPGRR